MKYDTIDTSVFEFKVPKTATAPLALEIQTDDPAKADPATMYTVHPFILMAQLGSHYENRAWFAFDVYVNDYCWRAPILQRAPALNFTFIDLLQPLTLKFAPWESRITYQSPNDETATEYVNQCGNISYTAVLASGDPLPAPTISFDEQATTFKAFG